MADFDIRKLLRLAMATDGRARCNAGQGPWTVPDGETLGTAGQRAQHIFQTVQMKHADAIAAINRSSAGRESKRKDRILNGGGEESGVRNPFFPRLFRRLMECGVSGVVIHARASINDPPLSPTPGALSL
jgi:hypothetical protein